MKVENQNKLVLGMTAVVLLLAVPYALVKTGVWDTGVGGPAISAASAASGQLPIRNPDELPVIGLLDDFSMTNQLGQTVRRADLLGQVWVADVIFTRCPGPCAMMTTRMADLQQTIPEQWPVKLVSLTADTEYDTPGVLRQYADNFGANAARWNFLHASKTAIVDLSVNNLKLVVLDKEQQRQSANDLFIHSTTLALVDKRGRLRGAFASVPLVVSEDTEAAPLDDWQSNLKPRLLGAIEQLIAED